MNDTWNRPDSPISPSADTIPIFVEDLGEIKM